MSTTAAPHAPASMRDLTLAELGTAWESGAITWDAMRAECDRRDAAERRSNAARAAARRRYADWQDAAHAQYIAADAYCRGNLLSPAGIRAGIADAFQLWRGSVDRARRYASEELREFWDYHTPRLSPAEYARGLRASAAAEREAAESEALDVARAAAVAELADQAADVDQAAELGAAAAAARAAIADLVAAPRPTVHLVATPARPLVRPTVRPVTLPAAPTVPSSAPGTIARYTRALTTYANHTDILAARVAARRALTERSA